MEDSQTPKKEESHSSLALHRRWRSGNFNEIVDQEHVVKTLKNALATGRIASAYLFCGPRGTGKTSTARILAKAINCHHTKDGQPCNKCSICRGINSGSFMDVIEMDAASHTQVEKIREFIVEKVNFRPAEAKFKVYIIDEVHKLSSHSFDALLKTIEEPPPFVIFILATTEPEKLPPTILSRCQRFDFKRIPVKMIVDRLKEISEAEKFCIEEGALNLIAQASDGALRDALVILEQGVSFSGECVKAGDIVSLLGITRMESLLEVGEIILEKDTARGLAFIDEVYRDGKDLHRLAADVLEHFRRLLIIKLVREAETMLEITNDLFNSLKGQSSRFKTAHLLHIIRELIDLSKDLKELGLDRILWEMAVVKLTRWEVTPTIDGLNRKIADLEKRISVGGIPAVPVVANTVSIASIPAGQYESLPSPAPVVKKKDSYAGREASLPEKSFDEAGFWHQFLRAIKQEKFNLLPIMQEVGAGAFKDDKYIISIDSQKPFNRNMLEMHRTYLQGLLCRLTNRKMELVLGKGPAGKLFQETQIEKPHKVFVQEVRDVFNAAPVEE